MKMYRHVPFNQPSGRDRAYLVHFDQLKKKDIMY